MEATQEHLEYLDELRESGITNMYGAGNYLQKAFGLNQNDASEVLGQWMNTFSDRHRE
jgi:hypothetical protein